MRSTTTEPARQSGFTLIELSIVLVIIGLIVGGILTGQDLINTAAIRSQISQIEKYNTAIRTFQNKYGYLPGDIPNPLASNFGFQSRGTLAGEGDGNGLLEGNCTNVGGGNKGVDAGCGELAVMWEDLSEAGLIDAGIKGFDTTGGANYPNIAGFGNHGPDISFTTTPTLYQWFPVAKLGNGVNFVYAFSMAGNNYFAVSSITGLTYGPYSSGNPGLTVLQAYNIDKKIDDGFPMTGSVTPCYINHNIASGSFIYAAAGGLEGTNNGNNATYGNCTPVTTAPYLSTDCYDTGGGAGPQTYALTQNASAQNCALSFKFQ